MAKTKNIRVDEATWDALKVQAHQERTTLGQLVDRAARVYLSEARRQAVLDEALSGPWHEGMRLAPATDGASDRRATLDAINEAGDVHELTTEQDAYSQAPARKAKKSLHTK